MQQTFSFEEGDTRKVILISSLGIVLKFPRFDFFEGVKNLLRILIIPFQEKWKFRARFWFKCILFGHYKDPHSVSYCWFRGIFANLNEFRYFIFNPRNPLIIPTYFSFFGIVNIQPIVNPLPQGYTIYNKCCKITDEKDEMRGRDSHAWENKNFTLKPDGRIALYDYASTQAWPMVKKYGERFSQILP